MRIAFSRIRWVALPLLVSGIVILTWHVQALLSVEPLPKGDFRLQQLDNSCGPAALAYVLQLHGLTVTEQELLSERPPGSKGTSFLDLAQLAERHGFSAKGFRLTLSDLALHPLPAIAHYRDHFVVVEAVGDNWVAVADPSVGRLKVSHRAFKWRWDGLVLFIHPGEG